MAEGFLGRWAQRKLAARQGKPLAEPEAARVPNQAPPLQAPGATSAPATGAPGISEQAEQAAELADVAVPASAEASAPDASPLTLQDAQALHPDSDFKPFVARGVDPGVRNAAMKKLFTDPHYNVMDGLDTYIDDYSQSDPLPDAMLRQMVSAQFLKLVDEEPESPNATPADATTTITRDNHAHTDLRLQPDHAPGGPETGRGAE